MRRRAAVARGSARQTTDRTEASTALASEGYRGYISIMPSARVQELLAAAAALTPDERQAFVEGLWAVREQTVAADDRHAELVRRVESVRRGTAETMSLVEVEQSLRSELDF
jgi:hypothetical protein